MAVSVNQDMVDTIAGDEHWNSATITYVTDIESAGAKNQDLAQQDFGAAPAFQRISPADELALEEVAKLWDELIAPSIVEINNSSANITVDQVTNIPSYEGGVTFTRGNADAGTLASAGVYLEPRPLLIGSDYDWTAAVHEFGHALGLQHPGSYNASPGTGPTYENNRTYDEDTGLFSIMSYFQPASYIATVNWSLADIRTPMIYDILAIQQIYGVDTTTRTGDTTYGFNTKLSDFASADEKNVFSFTQTKTDPTPIPTDGSSFNYIIDTKAVFTIWDAGGDHDRIDASLFTADQRIDLNPGTYSDIGETTGPDPLHPGFVKLVPLVDSIGIAFGVTIEEAIGGSGNDTITGNSTDNYLDGGAGNDVLSGGLGDDTLLGGIGDDTLSGGFGTDHLDGGADNDTLDGGGSLDGGGASSGPDLLTGGAGDDTFIYQRGYRATTITDFNKAGHDALDLTSTKIHNFSDLLAIGTQSGADLVFDLGATTTPQHDIVTLQNTTKDDLDPADFDFVEEVGPGYAPFRAHQDSIAGFVPHSANVVALSGGGFATVEARFGGDLFLFTYDEKGAELSSSLITTSSNQGFVVANLAPAVGGFVVAWAQTTTPFDYSINAQIFDGAGHAIAPAFQVNTTPIPTETPGLHTAETTFASAGDTGFTIEWKADLIPGSTPNATVLGRSFDNNGVALTSDTVLATTLNDYDPTGQRAHPGLYSYTFPNHTGLIIEHLTTTAEFGTEQRWFGRLTGSLDPIELPFLGTDGPFNVAQLDDGRIALTWVHFEQVGFSQFYGDPMLAILDSDLKGYSISGSSGDDRLVGGSYNDRLFGLDGNDTLIGGAGPDLLDGGSGTDTVSYYSSLNGVDVDLTRTGSQVGGHAQGDTLVSIENITGSSYDDTLKGDAGVNVIYGGYGADVIVGGGDADELHGQQGDDQITLNGNNGTAWGDAGNDIITLLGDAGAVAHGGNGNDEIDILGNGASAFGDGGQDTYVINGDNNYVDDLGDDESLDKFFINGNNNQVFGELGPNSFRLSYLSHSSGNMLFGGPGDDTFENLGDGDTNTFYGGEGADTITGGVGNDLIFTDESYPPSVGDVVHADAGDDQVVSKGNQDLLDGGPGTDTLTLDLNWFPGDILVTFDEHSQQFTMPDGTVAIGFENVEINMGYGTNTVQAASYTGSLVLRGDSGGAIDIFETGSGNDRLYGSGFNNILKAGEGDDYFNETGVGANLIEGGAGHNSLSYEYVYGGIYADLANERVYSKGNGGGFDSEADLVDATTFDTVRGIEKIYGGYYNDQIRGSTADETFLPGHGNDGVVGGGGRDTVDYSNADYAVVASLVTGIVTEFAADNEIGKRFDTVLSMDHVAGISNLTGSGNDDDLTGDHADNVITGGRHDDLLTGNGGADIFVYRDNDGTDTLTDFAPGVDRIDLTGVVGKYELADLNIFQDGANTVISFEPIQGAGFAAFAANEFFGSGIVLENVQMGDLTERDFIFASRPSENQAPVAALTNTVVTDEDIASAPVAIGASDPDGDTLSYAIKSGFGPTAGTVGFANGGFTYTPNANANGSDTFTIVIDDGHGGRVEQVVSVTINPVNDAPVAAATNAVVTNEDTTSAPVAIGASDVDGDTLSYTIKSGFEPAAGTVAFANGSFTYAPHADASGPDTFAIVIDDGHGGTTEQVVSVTINTLDTSAAAPSATLATDSGLAGDGITNVGTVDVSGLATSATWQYAVNGGNFITGTGTSVTLTGDGPKAVLVHQTDAAGNVSANASLNFTLDTVAAAPAVALATDSGVVGDRITKVGTVNVSGLEAGASWEYAVNGGSFIAGTGTSVTLSGDGPKAVLVHQIDTAGNVSADASLNFTLDTVAAAPAVALATDSGVVGDRITKVGTVNVSGLEAGASWEYAVNGGSFIVGTGTSVTLSGDGPKTVLVHQTDTAGIVSANASLNFTLDTAAAAPSVSLATDSGLVGDDITKVGTVNVSGLEAGASWEYAVNGGELCHGHRHQLHADRRRTEDRSGASERCRRQRLGQRQPELHARYCGGRTGRRAGDRQRHRWRRHHQSRHGQRLGPRGWCNVAIRGQRRELYHRYRHQRYLERRRAKDRSRASDRCRRQCLGGRQPKFHARYHGRGTVDRACHRQRRSRRRHHQDRHGECYGA